MPAPKESPESTQRLSNLTDEEIGRSIRDDVLALVRGRVKNELVVGRAMDSMSERFFDATISDPTTALHSVAYVFAIAEQYERAGRALRAFYEDVFPLLRNAEERKKALDALIALNVEKEVEAAKRRERWRQHGLKFRNAERGWPKDNGTVARYIKDQTGDKVGEIYKEIGALGLGAKLWRDKVRATNAVKSEQAPNVKNKRTRNKSLAKLR